MVTALAVDLGSSSGRIVAGTFGDGRVEAHAAHRRFQQATLHWIVVNDEDMFAHASACEPPIYLLRLHQFGTGA